MKFRAIPGYENKYSINTEGQIKSEKRLVVARNGKEQLYPERILRPGDNGKGYKYVNLSKEGKSKRYYVHRLMGMVYLNLSKNKEINHKDGNKGNNNLSNLEVCTHRENTEHAKKTGLKSNHDGRDWKLNKKKVLDIRSMLRDNRDIEEIANKHGITKHYVKQIKRDYRWASIQLPE